MATGFVFAGINSIYAEEITNNFNLDEYVITATRSEKAISDIPANVQIITGTEIKDGGYQSVFEAVKNLAQANVHTYQDDGGDYGAMMSRIRLRGIDDATLILINGNPVNYMNHASLNNIPMEQIERIEIVKGANSVLYGPQAMGGVINIITKKHTQVGKISGNVFGSIGNKKKDMGTNITTDLINFGYKKVLNDDFTNAVLPGSTGKGTAIDIIDKESEQIYLDANISKNTTFSYGRTISESKFKTGSYNDFVANFNKLTAYKSRFDNYSVVYDGDNGWKAVAGYNTVRMDSRPDLTYVSHNSYSNYYGYSTNIDVQKNIKFNDDTSNIILGANYNREYMENNSGTKFNSNGRDSYSLYQSLDIKPWENFEFIFGLREYYVNKTSYQDSDFQILPQIQGIYKANNDSNYYFNIGKSFQMPGITSAFYYDDNYIINPDLKPQTGWSYEVGYKYDDGDKFLAVDAFYMNVKDKFYWDKDSENRHVMRNRDKWKNTGIELTYKQKINSNFSGSMGVTFQNPKALSKNIWVQDAAKVIANVGLTYNDSKFNADTRLFTYLNREPAYYNMEHTSSTTKDHNLKNLVDLTLTLSYKPTKNDTLRLVGRNLLNRDDALNNYEYVTMPRNFIFTYERSF